MLGPVFNLGGGLVVRFKMLVMSGYTPNPKTLNPKPISINSRVPGEGSFGLPERRGRGCTNFAGSYYKLCYLVFLSGWVIELNWCCHKWICGFRVANALSRGFLIKLVMSDPHRYQVLKRACFKAASSLTPPQLFDIPNRES